MRRLLPSASIIALLFITASAFSIPQISSPNEPATREKPTGATLFREKGCEHCHGVDGVGVPDRGPSLLTVGKRLKKDAIARQVEQGGKGMPAFGTALEPDEITALVDFLSKKKKAPRQAALNKSGSF
jgi:mono/diheme cytochrome c family protein